MAVRPASFKQERNGRGEKTQLQLAQQERRDRQRTARDEERDEIRQEQRRAHKEQLALATGKRLVDEFFPNMEKGQTFIYRRPELIEAEEGKLNNQQLWARNCSDIIKFCIASKRRRSDRFIFTPGPGDEKTFKDVGYLKLEVAWTEKKPEALKKAA